ncbi:MAG: hypothetical protein IJS15_03040 [Victivallales bacterium]|nr:hypothetical protein [Victivallales bacterium]
MAIDWTRYPGLTKTPVVPKWRDTPQREAFWREYESMPHFCSRKKGLLILLLLDLLLSVAVMPIVVRMLDGELECGIWDLLVGFLIIAFEMLLPSILLWFIIYSLFRIYQLTRLSRKYGFVMLRLRRPNVSKEISAILEERPPFDKESFLAMWPSPQHAKCAERLIVLASEYWRLPDKMLYPNDPLLFLFFGKSFPLWWNRMIEPPGDFWDDLLQEFTPTEAIATIDKGSPIAELVECLLGNK